LQNRRHFVHFYHKRAATTRDVIYRTHL
jgi:hypothetical protein